MNNATRRQLLEQARQVGYTGSILDVFQNPQVLDQFVQEQQQVQQQPQQPQQQMQVEMPTPPATTPNYRVPQPRQSEAQPLVMSNTEVPIQIRRSGGILYENGGPKDKGWREYKTATGESLYLDPRFKDQRYYVNEKGDHVTPDQNMSLFDVKDNIWESGTSLPTLDVSPRYKYVQRPGALGAMETVRMDLDNGSQETISPDVMATKREMDAFANATINPAGLLVTGVGNIAQGNIVEGALETALSVPVVGQVLGKAITAPLKFAGREIAQTYGPALSEVGQYFTQGSLKNTWKLNPYANKNVPLNKLYHKSDDTNLLLDDIDLFRVGKSQSKRRYANLPESEKPSGFYTSDEAFYPFMGGKSKYSFDFPANAKIKDLAVKGRTTDRISQSELKQLADEGYDLIRGKNMIGLEEYIPLNKSKMQNWKFEGTAKTTNIPGEEDLSVFNHLKPLEDVRFKTVTPHWLKGFEKPLSTSKTLPGSDNVNDVVKLESEILKPRFNLQRSSSKPKDNMFNKKEDLSDETFNITKIFKGRNEEAKIIPNSINIIGKSGNWQLNKNANSTFSFNANMTNPVESGKAMLKMNKLMPPKPTILEEKSYSLDSWLNHIKLKDRSHWSGEFNGYIPLNHSAIHNKSLAKFVPEATTEYSVFKNQTDAEEALQIVNNLIKKQGVTQEAKILKTKDAYQIQVPNFKLTRDYKTGGKKCYTCNQSKLQVLYNKRNYKK